MRGKLSLRQLFFLTLEGKNLSRKIKKEFRKFLLLHLLENNQIYKGEDRLFENPELIGGSQAYICHFKGI